MSEPLRILHAIRSDRFAGVEQFVRRLATQQRADGHRVAVAGGAERQMREPLERAGIVWRPASTTADIARLVARTAATLDVVNTHMTAADIGAVTALAGRRRRPAIIATRHFAKRRGSLGPSTLYRLVERGIDAEIAISRAVAERLGVPSSVIYPGVAPVEPTDAAARGPRILIAQRLEAEKHTDVGIRAFATSGLADTGWSLEVAGEGSERARLEAVAGDAGVAGSIRFLGFRDDVPQLMATASVLLATCPWEHFGLTVLEAMAAGLPVVAAGAAGHVELLGGLDDRGLYTPDDAREAADDLRSLVADPAGRAAYAEAARERQQRDFSLRAQADATERLYVDVIAQRQREPA